MKGEWEYRVGMLLKSDAFVWTHKCPDSAMYGGAPRVDWIACDVAGGFWMLEVKQLPEDRRSINLMKEVSAGQRDALDSVAKSDLGVALLAVGQGQLLYLFDWRGLSWRYEPMLSMTQTQMVLKWIGPKAWAEYDLYEGVTAGTAAILSLPVAPSPKRARSR